MAKNIDFETGGIGDIEAVMHNQGLVDLSWLVVDEAAYRASETLPKQNLDIIEDLQHALAYEDGDDVPKLVPMKPVVFVTENQIPNSYANLDSPIIKRTASYVMQGEKESEIIKKLSLEFDKRDLKLAGDQIRATLDERGLLGNVYVDSSHYNKCHQLNEGERKLVASSAKKSLFVIANSRCGGCVCNKQGMCSSFKKRIVSSVNYTPQLASHYFPELSVTKRAASFVQDSLTWKEKLKIAFNHSAVVSSGDGIQSIQYQKQSPKLQFTDEQISSALTSEVRENPVVLSSAYIKYADRMQSGIDDRKYLIESGDPELTRLASQHGILGHVYYDVDAAGSCSKAYRDISGSISYQYAVRRASVCHECRNIATGGCAKISAIVPLLKDVQPVGRMAFTAALANEVTSGRISSTMAEKAISRISDDMDFGLLTSQLYKSAPRTQVASYSGPKLKEKSLNVFSSTKNEVAAEDVERTVGHLLNTGLSGSALIATIRQRYSSDELKQHQELGRRFASMDGVQGHYFVDPSVYSDYGRGCNEGASHFRKLGAKNVLACNLCTGCKMQTAPGWCSKYAKTLVRSIPNEVIASVKMARSLPVLNVVPVVNPVEQYGLSSGITMDLSGSKDRSISIDISNNGFGD
jgi:hypothetical protein